MLQQLAARGLRSVLSHVYTRSLASVAAAVTELSGAQCPRSGLAGVASSSNEFAANVMPFGLTHHSLRAAPTVFQRHDRLFSAAAAAAAPKAAQAAPPATAAAEAGKVAPARAAPARKTRKPVPGSAEATARAIAAAARKAATAAAAKAKAQAKAYVRRERARERKQLLKQRQAEKNAEARAAAKAKKDARIARAPSAQNLFIKDYLKELRDQGKLKSPFTREAAREAFTAAAKRFKELKPEELRPYQERAAAAKAATTAKRAQLKEANRARRGMTPFMIYFGERVPVVRAANPGMRVTEAAKIVAETWRGMDAAARAPYLDKANETRKALGLAPRASAFPVEAKAAKAKAQ